MTNIEMLELFGEARSKYVVEAQSLRDNRNVGGKKHISTRKRWILIAAVISLLLLLVGCAIVYALRLQDMSIGKETYTQRFDDTGKAIEPVEKTRDVLTLYGHNGDPIQLAMKEWDAFLATYDPEFKLSDNIPDHPEIPNYLEWTYDCYTLDMANKVQEIAAKHNLKLLEEWIPFQQYQSDIFFEETGIDSFVLPDSGAKVSNMAGMFFPPYNFSMEFVLKTENLIALNCDIDYVHKAYFPEPIFGGADLTQISQWDHTAPDGTKLLLALGSKGKAYIIAELPDTMMILSINGNFSGSAYPSSDEIITKEQLEKVADVFDYSIQPGTVDRAVVQAKLDAAEAAYQAEHTYVEPVHDSFNEYLTWAYERPNEDLQYTFYDLTGDGVDELLIGTNGAFYSWVTIRDGKAHSRMMDNTYLCENGILEALDEYEIYETHNYFTSGVDDVIDDLDMELKQIVCILRERDQWYDTTVTVPYQPDREITQEQAQDIISKYKRVELKWKPLMEYPLAEGYTLRDYLNEKDVRVSASELREIYRDYLKEREAKATFHYSHYRIQDINGDGVEDLLLKGEDDSFIGHTDYYWIALTYRYGQIMHVWMSGDFYLCENGVLEFVETRHQDMGVEVNGHRFIRMDGFEEKNLGFTAYNKATASWWGDWHNEIPMTEDEANAILAKYPRIDQGMIPIEELLK